MSDIVLLDNITSPVRHLRNNATQLINSITYINKALIYEM